MKKFTHRFLGSLSDIESLPASGGAIISSEMNEENTKTSSTDDILNKLFVQFVYDLKKGGISVKDFDKIEEDSPKVYLGSVNLKSTSSTERVQEIFQNSKLYKHSNRNRLHVNISILVNGEFTEDLEDGLTNLLVAFLDNVF